ncbi:threonine--tRNA ligase [Candidatus Kaiserbacteria bacterium RIFCSPLOWO2_01_FULL_53_17]|uniref:Threonine--tRNA ligase n=1 Tax=Candidatus Kaiserbacteria bacterium RIFCSPLOWO2_01_FULL_53_17 TaxID=1798511 RepID=A0A1F6EHR1_9BACT|nr:MAG: threonine--tRNA ligase [Candidatus Kaiserbacteria bacterium RIFCSPLOWO2_01_FULL_53_17]
MSKPNIEHVRHTLAHLLAQAVLEHYPSVQLTLGPVIDSGFYYDVDFGDEKISDADLPKIEETMRKNFPHWQEFAHEEVSKNEALTRFKGNPFKSELIEEIAAKGEKIMLYTCGGFTDLCRGGHVENPSKDIAPDSFKLDRIAGAYWRGNEKNPMLTRMYGLSFATKKELDEYLAQREEAEKRDHRRLGKELRIFMFDDDVGPGLPLWLPNGAIIIEELEKLAKETEERAGYKRVRTPHIAKESMYRKSGHLPYYEESMFPPMEYEGGKYYLKAMNCPHHHKIFAAEPRSYRGLPLRLAEYGTVYRHEKSGELFGLMRVRMLSMNDAHIYCSEGQFADEFRAVNEMYLHYFKIFGIAKYVMRFSTHDPKKLGEKYVDEPELWKKTEDMVRQVLIESKIPYVEIPNEAAFYGPKIDVQVWSAIGREFTLATNQVDFAVPKRFGLTYVDQNGEEKTPLCIHRAPLSTHERFTGFLIEHYAGAFPTWLAPMQVKILPISEKHVEYAKEIFNALRDAHVRVELDDSNETLGKKVRNAKVEKVPYTLVIGDAEVEALTVTVEHRDKGKIGTMPLEEFQKTLVEEIKNRL